MCSEELQRLVKEAYPEAASGAIGKFAQAKEAYLKSRRGEFKAAIDDSDEVKKKRALLETTKGHKKRHTVHQQIYRAEAKVVEILLEKEIQAKARVIVPK